MMCQSRRHSEVRDACREKKAAWREARREMRRHWREGHVGWDEETGEAAPSGLAAQVAALTVAVEKLASRIGVLEKIVVDDDGRLAREIDRLRTPSADAAGPGETRP